MSAADGQHAASEAERRATLRRWIGDDSWMMRALGAVQAENLPDAWIVAGFVRNKVWDTLHGFSKPTPPSDLDVVFFDPERPAADDRGIEAQLAARAPEYPWEVYNQAHTHTFNGHSPYTSTEDAVARWAETVSTVGARLNAKGRPEIVAPHGLADLFEMIIRPTPHPDALVHVFEARLVEKAWQRQWPKSRDQKN